MRLLTHALWTLEDLVDSHWKCLLLLFYDHEQALRRNHLRSSNLPFLYHRHVT
jgi:hypothetical protein